MLSSLSLGRRGQTLVVLTTTLAASSLLFASRNNEASSFLRSPDDTDRRQLQAGSFSDPKSVELREFVEPQPSDILNQVVQNNNDQSYINDQNNWFMQNSQWCQNPDDDEHYAPPIDYTQCKNRELIHMDINGGMTSYLNKILKVAMWAAREERCFYVNEERYGDGPEGKHFSRSKLGYRLIDGRDTYIVPFLTRYFEQMGLEKAQFEEIMADGKHSFITPMPKEISRADHQGRSSLTSNNPKERFELMSLPHMGYTDVDRISLKKHFLRRMFRLKPHVRDAACHRVSSHGLEDDYIALSVRRGDKETETTILHTVRPYIKAAERAIESHFGGVRPSFFVATDDCAVMEEFRKARPKWNFVSECDNASEENGFVFKEMKLWNDEQTDAHFGKFIAEMIAMATAKYWIGVASTNVSYWIYFMRSLDAQDDTFVWVDPPRIPGLPW